MAEQRKRHRQSHDDDDFQIVKRPRSTGVTFNPNVQVREMHRRMGGSQGIPQSGHWPLGLDWQVADEYLIPIKTPVEPTQSQTPTRRRSLARRVAEHDRKSIITEHQDDMSDIDLERQDIEHIRETRRFNMFCSCQSQHSRVLTRSTKREIESSKKRSSISSSASSGHNHKRKERLCSIARPDHFGVYCQCAQAGMACYAGLCSCSIECGNPFGLISQSKKQLHTRRSQVCDRANQELENSPTKQKRHAQTNGDSFEADQEFEEEEEEEEEEIDSQEVSSSLFIQQLSADESSRR
jgi:hypothetical protein